MNLLLLPEQMHYWVALRTEPGKLIKPIHGAIQCLMLSVQIRLYQARVG